MTLNEVSSLAEIAASLAVVFSLFYLAIQVRQSNVLSRAQTRQSMMQLGQDELFLEVAHPDLVTAFTKESISEEERVKLNAWLTAAMRAREYEWFAHRDGVVDTPMFQSYVGVIPILLGTERSRKWWDAHRDINEFDSEFVKFVDRVLEQPPVAGYWEAWNKW